MTRSLHIGSVSLALETTAEQILKALKTLNPKSFIFLDPNVRLTVVKEKERYLRHLIEAMKLSNLVKLSTEDIELLFPFMKERDAIEQILALGVENVVLTRAEKGLSWFSNEDLRVDVEAIEVDVVDTVGAGDTVSGALLTYLEENEIGPGDLLDEDEIIEALEFASKAASITVSQSGANPPYLDQVQSL